jgi:hemolysin D
MSESNLPQAAGGAKAPLAFVPIGRILAGYRRQQENRRDYEFLPATLEVLERPPAPFSRAMLLLIVMFASVATLWACVARMDIVVSATGVVIPKGKVKIVQPLEPGIVTAIHVRDGQTVKAGDALVAMDKADGLADINTLRKDLAQAELAILRLNAELQHDASLFAPPPGADAELVRLSKRLLDQSIAAHGEKISTLAAEIQRCSAECDTIRVNVKKLTESLPLTLDLYEKKKNLAEKQLISQAELVQAKIEANDARHNLQAMESQSQEAAARLARSREDKDLAAKEYKRDLLRQLTEANNNRENLSHQLTKAENRQTHFDLKAPADGIVQQLAVHTIGGVVTAAQPLMIIVPTDGGLEIEAKVLNKDIGFVSQAQEVSVKVAAYPNTQYGDLKGRIEWVASDAVIDQQLGPNYPIRVAVDNYRLPNIVNGRQGVISPGMTVTADVKVGRRRVIEYFLGPIMRYKDQSLREM